MYYDDGHDHDRFTFYDTRPRIIYVQLWPLVVSPTETITISNAWFNDSYRLPRTVPNIAKPKEWRWFHRFYRAHMPRCPICRADFIYCRCRPHRGQEPRNVHQARQEKRKRYIQSLQ